MHPLLRFTLDLFEQNQAVAPENAAHSAIELIAAEPHKPAKRLEDVIAPAKFHHPRANREARLCDAVVAYEFKRGKRRTIGFSVGPDGLVVRAPKWVPLYEVDAALQESRSGSFANWARRGSVTSGWSPTASSGATAPAFLFSESR